MIKGRTYQSYNLATTGSIFKLKKYKLIIVIIVTVIYNKEYTFGLHPSSWHRAPETLEFPKC